MSQLNQLLVRQIFLCSFADGCKFIMGQSHFRVVIHYNHNETQLTEDKLATVSKVRKIWRNDEFVKQGLHEVEVH